jgi:hypothetical protein
MPTRRLAPTTVDCVDLLRADARNRLARQACGARPTVLYGELIGLGKVISWR